MKKTITAVIFLFALTASAAFGQTTAGEWYDKAGEYFKSGDYAGAITAYSETIRRDSSNINAYWFRGFAYYRTKNYDAAIADSTTVIKGAPDFPDAYIVRGDAYGARGVYHSAAADYKTGLEKGFDPNFFDVDKSSKASMWFCGAMFMEITVNRFLGKSDVAAKYEDRLKIVCDKNKLTRAEVEAFYRQNIGSLIAAEVDKQFKNTLLSPDEIQAVKDILAVFFVRPNTTTFNAVRDVSFIYTVAAMSLSREKKRVYSNVAEAYDNTLRLLSPDLSDSVHNDVVAGDFNVKSGTNSVVALARMVQQ